MQNLCWERSTTPFVNAGTKRRCLLKPCNLKFINKCCLQTDLRFIFFVFQHGHFVKVLIAIWLVPVSHVQSCLLWFLSGLITPQKKCIRKQIYTSSKVNQNATKCDIAILDNIDYIILIGKMIFV